MALAAIAVTAFLTGCGGGSGKYRESDGMVWNTTYHILWNGPQELGDSVMKTLEEVGSSLNVFDTTSLVARVNAAEKPVEIDRHFAKVYEMSRKIWEESEGMFDPTLSPLITAWGFGPGHRATSDTLRLDSLMKFVGFSKTRLEGNRLFKEDPRIVFNFSAVAKGYGCDAVAEMFERNGVKDYMVEIGGEIRCEGKSPRHSDWNISIDRPVRSTGVIHESQAVVSLKGGGVATSGNYRNFKAEGSGAIGHTISAQTGRPMSTDVLSATVLAPDAMQADAMATACMTLGSKKSLELCKKLDCPVMLILADTTLMSDSFKKLIIE